MRWGASDACPAEFAALFLPIDGVEFISEADATNAMRAGASGRAGDGAGDGAGDARSPVPRTVVYKGHAGVAKLVKQHLSGPGHADAASSAERVGQLYGLLRPVTPIQEAVDAFAAQHGKHTQPRTRTHHHNHQHHHARARDHHQHPSQPPTPPPFRAWRPVPLPAGFPIGSLARRWRACATPARVPWVRVIERAWCLLCCAVSADVHTRVGLHVRRTDHVKMATAHGKYTCDDDFIRIAQAAVAEDARATFFLATDDAATQRSMLAHPALRGRTVTYATIPHPAGTDGDGGAGAGTQHAPGGTATATARHSPLRQTSMAAAVADLFLLARCKEIHGSGDSTYSECAQALLA